MSTHTTGPHDAGSLVGSYRLKEELGRGGTGVVWLAERVGSDFRQQVALKLIKRGMDTEEVLARFKQERRLLARLQHPNIARLLDGGVSGDGRPWFAMEHVQGRPLLAYCNDHRMMLDARLALFSKVVEAVQHAHRNLIVHRDLKPSNVLVTVEGEPKLLDFGISKLLEPSADDGSQAPLTRTGTMIMTPRYAAPEQVLGEPITTATDVYSLGVLLYELLADASPYGQCESDSELLRSVLTREPPPPSAMARRANQGRGGARAAVASGRLAGDLDRICLTALRKEPTRRYASAQALVDDVRRYRHGFPVAARPDSLTYRFSKYVRRNRIGVGAAVLVLLALSVGLSFATWQAQRATRQAQRAEQVLAFLVEIFEANAPLAKADREVTAADILEAGAERLQSQFVDEPLVQAELLQVVGRLYTTIGDLDAAEPLLERSLALLQSPAKDAQALYVQSLLAMATIYHERTDYEKTEANLRQALAFYRAESPHDREVLADALRRHAIVLSEMSRYAEAEPLHYEALAMARRLHGDESLHVAEIRHDLAQHLKWQGRFDDAEPHYRQALAIKRRLLGDGHVNVAATQANFGVLLGQRGDYGESDALLRAALATETRVYGAVHPATAITTNNLSMLHYVQGNYEQAEPLIRRALALNQQLFGRENERVATNLNNLANLLAATGRVGEALPMLEEALAMRRRVLEAGHPRIAISLSALGRVLLSVDDVPRAAELLRQAREIVEASLAPSHPYYARVLVVQGEVRLAQGRLAEAQEVLRRGLALREANLAAGSWEIAEAQSLLGRCLLALDRPQEALALLQAASLTLAKARAPDDPLRIATESALATATERDG